MLHQKINISKENMKDIFYEYKKRFSEIYIPLGGTYYLLTDIIGICYNFIDKINEEKLINEIQFLIEKNNSILPNKTNESFYISYIKENHKKNKEWIMYILAEWFTEETCPYPENIKNRQAYHVALMYILNQKNRKEYLTQIRKVLLCSVFRSLDKEIFPERTDSNQETFMDKLVKNTNIDDQIHMTFIWNDMKKKTEEFYKNINEHISSYHWKEELENIKNNIIINNCDDNIYHPFETIAKKIFNCAKKEHIYDNYKKLMNWVQNEYPKWKEKNINNMSMIKYIESNAYKLYIQVKKNDILLKETTMQQNQGKVNNIYGNIKVYGIQIFLKMYILYTILI